MFRRPHREILLRVLFFIVTLSPGDVPRCPSGERRWHRSSQESPQGPFSLPVKYPMVSVKSFMAPSSAVFSPSEALKSVFWNHFHHSNELMKVIFILFFHLSFSKIKLTLAHLLPAPRTGFVLRSKVPVGWLDLSRLEMDRFVWQTKLFWS